MAVKIIKTIPNIRLTVLSRQRIPHQEVMHPVTNGLHPIIEPGAVGQSSPAGMLLGPQSPTAGAAGAVYGVSVTQQLLRKETPP